MHVIDFFNQLRSAKIGNKPWFSGTKFRKTGQIGRFKVTAEMRSKDGWMGRFGGGWQYKLGIDIGGSTIIFNLLVMTLRIHREKKKEVDPVAD